MQSKPMATAKTLWLTGLSGAGKTTLAKAIRARLLDAGLPTLFIDGDELRGGLCADLGFTAADRSENVRRAAQIAKLANENDIHAVVALISPYQSQREAAKQIVGDSAYFEVYLATPLAVCEQRDVKGLYRRARMGGVNEFTGLSSPYEIPSHPDVVIDTSCKSVDQCIDEIEAGLARKKDQTD